MAIAIAMNISLSINNNNDRFDLEIKVTISFVNEKSIWMELPISVIYFQEMILHFRVKTEKVNFCRKIQYINNLFGISRKHSIYCSKWSRK
jgi:hypothetical protein